MKRMSRFVPPGTRTSAAKRLRFARPCVVSQLDPIDVTVNREGWSRERFRNSETRDAYVWKVDGAMGRRPVGGMTAAACPVNPVNSRNGMATIASHRARVGMSADNAQVPKADVQDRHLRRDGRDDPEDRQRRQRRPAG